MALEGWAIVELMGHRRLAGMVSEVEVAGTGFIRVEVLQGERFVTQLYAPGAVYAITPTTEETARQSAAINQVEPVNRWEMRALPARTADDDEGIPDF